MDTSDQNIRELFERWFNNVSTPSEEEALFELLHKTNRSEELHPAMKDLWDQLQAGIVYTSEEKDLLADKILQHHHQEQPEQPLRIVAQRRLWRAVAAVICLVGTGALYWVLSMQLSRHTPVELSHIGPGKNGAILQLADGTQVVLDSLHNGVVATQSNTQLVLHNGSLSYNAAGKTDTDLTAAQYNTMITPRGRQFEVVLPDGTKVWLNAASMLRFPAAFTGKDRRVELKGEAYFEVATNSQQPFKVVLDDHNTIEVLGTHFNVNAYADEQSMHTTLLEGAVQVQSFDTNRKISPGEEASVGHSTGAAPQINVQPVDITAAVAWKDGVFYFNNTDVQVVMRQLSRWYDVEIVYEKGVPDLKVWGKMQRNLKLEQVLKILSGMELKCRLENGRKLIVLP